MFRAMTGDDTKLTRADTSAPAVWLICGAIYAVFMALIFIAPDILKGPQTALGRDWELGLIETSQNIVLLIALVLAVLLAFRARDRGLRLWAIAIALGTLFVLGEEISWGQHYFGWATGDLFARINDQNETNLHNTEGGWFDQKPRAILLLGMILGTIVHPLVKRFRKGRGLFDRPWWLAPTVASLPPVVFALIAGLPKAIDKLNDDLNLYSFSLQAALNEIRASEFQEIFLYIFFITYTVSLLERLPAKLSA